MTLRLLCLTTAGLTMLACGGCVNRGDRYATVQSGNQGSFSIKQERNPVDDLPPPPQPVAARAPSGPTTREIELQQKIDDLQAQQKAMNDEIRRLKDEKSKATPGQ